MACCAVFPRTKLDSAQTHRKGFCCDAEAHRMVTSNSLIDKRNTRIEIAYRSSPYTDCICNMKFYDDRVAEINTITTTADSCANLCSKYFNLYSAKDGTQFYVWYSVGCMGIDPAVCCATGIQVCIASCDPAAVVALATQQQVDLNANFCASVKTSVVTITNSSIGLSTAASSGCGLCSFTYANPTSGKNALQYTLDFIYLSCMSDQLITIDRS